MDSRFRGDDDKCQHILVHVSVGFVGFFVCLWGVEVEANFGIVEVDLGYLRAMAFEYFPESLVLLRNPTQFRKEARGKHEGMAAAPLVAR